MDMQSVVRAASSLVMKELSGAIFTPVSFLIKKILMTKTVLLRQNQVVKKRTFLPCHLLPLERSHVPKGKLPWTWFHKLNLPTKCQQGNKSNQVQCKGSVNTKSILHQMFRKCN